MQVSSTHNVNEFYFMFDKIKTAVRRQLNLLDEIGKSNRTVQQLCASLQSVDEQSLQIQRESLIHLLLQNKRYAEVGRLNSYEFNVFSQSGQDGIIEEILRRVGTTNKLCVEFGVGAGGGFENNSTYLLAQGWKGCWIEADRAAVERIRQQMEFLISAGRLKLLLSTVTVANISGLFEQLEVPKEFDLLSMDIDSFEFWVWRALSSYRPRVIVVEYNSFLPASADWVLPYEPNVVLKAGSIEFGASLKAFARLGEEIGYRLVGCDLTGSDAFFVRDDLVGGKFCEPFTAENHYEPMRYHLIKRWGYARILSSRFGTIG